MMMASTEGAMAFSKGLGAVHSMSHALGANQEIRLHHGTLNAVILPSILRFNKDHVGNKYSRIARAMGKDESIDLANEIEKLNEEIGIPKNLAEMGVTEDMIL
jgi:Alcohol dehydrogenase, class IV